MIPHWLCCNLPRKQAGSFITERFTEGAISEMSMLQVFLVVHDVGKSDGFRKAPGEVPCWEGAVGIQYNVIYYTPTYFSVCTIFKVRHQSTWVGFTCGFIYLPLFGDPEDTANNVSQQKDLPSFGSVLATTRHKKKFIQVLSCFQEHAWSTDLIADAPLWCDAQVVNDSLPFDMRQGLSHGTFEARKTDFFSRNQVSLQQLWVCFILIEATFHNLKNMFGDMNHESKDEHQGRCNFTCT